ncbi:hypothetical protein [Novacetimonas sp. GS1]|uniref:hypothetical protein n=1 Tax=Novacetimonas sp. GS1 TaxID=3119990 RepID=UPI002FCD5EF0
MTRLQTPPEIADHLMTEAEARTFHFRKPSGGSAYWFNLTWIRGKLILSGDFGDITLTCFPACATFAGAITWAVDAEFEYLMEKTGERRSYDEVRTLEDIIAWANAPVIEELNGTERRRDVLVEKDGRKRYEVIRTKLRDGYRHACQDYRRAVAAGTRDDCRTGLDETDPRRFTLQVPEDAVMSMWFDKPDISRFYSYEPCWDRWLSLWRDTYGRDWSGLPKYDPPSMVTTHMGRWGIKDELERRLTDPGRADLTCLCEGSVEETYDYTYSQRRQIGAVQFACRKIIEAGLVDAGECAA